MKQAFVSGAMIAVLSMVAAAQEQGGESKGR